VIPALGEGRLKSLSFEKSWMPACAGMTGGGGAEPLSQISRSFLLLFCKKEVFARVEPIGFPDLNGRKSALAVVALTPRVTVATPAAPLLNDPDNMVEAGSAIYAAATGLRNGAAVVFSGKFFASGSNCMKEDSVTEDGLMSSPEFKIRLTSLRGTKCSAEHASGDGG
jgi:hypothetical protein